ncbi:MAG TPA: hypothetical protein VD862_01205 [Candidatus Paceibacterota bacterium]|nr:hypothetical protein [Candidatus Paceibacterota bacterium]
MEESRSREELIAELAQAQSDLGDARAEITMLESAIDAHYEATFGHSACFLRDETLWSVRTAKDGRERKWRRDSVVPRLEFRSGCRNYEDSLYGPEEGPGAAG